MPALAFSPVCFLPPSMRGYEVKALTVRTMSILVIISPACRVDGQIQLCLCPEVSKAGFCEIVHHIHKIRKAKKHFKRCLKYV